MSWWFSDTELAYKDVKVVDKFKKDSFRTISTGSSKAKYDEVVDSLAQAFYANGESSEKSGMIAIQLFM